MSGPFSITSRCPPRPGTIFGAWKAKRFVSFDPIGNWGVFTAGVAVMDIELRQTTPSLGVVSATLKVRIHNHSCGRLTGRDLQRGGWSWLSRTLRPMAKASGAGKSMDSPGPTSRERAKSAPAVPRSLFLSDEQVRQLEHLIRQTESWPVRGPCTRASRGPIRGHIFELHAGAAVYREIPMAGDTQRTPRLESPSQLTF